MSTTRARFILDALQQATSLIVGRRYDSTIAAPVEAGSAVSKVGAGLPPATTRSAPTFFSAICIAATVAFYLN